MIAKQAGPTSQNRANKVVTSVILTAFGFALLTGGTGCSRELKSAADVPSRNSNPRQTSFFSREMQGSIHSYSVTPSTSALAATANPETATTAKPETASPTPAPTPTPRMLSITHISCNEIGYADNMQIDREAAPTVRNDGGQAIILKNISIGGFESELNITIDPGNSKELPATSMPAFRFDSDPAQPRPSVGRVVYGVATDVPVGSECHDIVIKMETLRGRPLPPLEMTLILSPVAQ